MDALHAHAGGHSRDFGTVAQDCAKLSAQETASNLLSPP